MRALIKMRRMHVEVSLDLEFFSKFSTLICFLVGSPVRIAFELPTRWRKHLVTHTVPIDHQVHVTEVFLSQLRPLGLHTPKQRAPIMLQIAEAEVQSSRNRLNLDPAGSQMICVNVNSGEASLARRWPKTKFANLVCRLAEEYPDTQFYFTGIGSERDYVEEVLELVTESKERLKNVAGKLSLGEFLGLLGQSRLLITCDSGPLHFASALGVPSVSFFGPEAPDFYGPLNSVHTVFYKQTLCSPCLNVYQAKEFRCPYHQRCLERIQVDEVVEAARRILSRGSVGRSVA